MSDDLADTLESTVGKTERRERRGDDRRKNADRRKGDRRKGGPSDYCGEERRKGDRRTRSRRTKAERRLGGVSGKRAEDRKAFEERIENGELTLEEVEFIRAIDRYKRKYNRPFPSWSEILLVVKELGYTKDAI
jgi:hypothetical protein